MKVRLLPLAAVAAVAMGAQGFAQSQGDDLDRALADLNSSVAAPLPGSVDAPQSSSLSFSGSARARNTWLNPAGMAGNQKAIDVRTNPDKTLFAVLKLFGTTRLTIERFATKNDKVEGYKADGSLAVSVPLEEPFYERPFHDTRADAYRFNEP